MKDSVYVTLIRKLCGRIFYDTSRAGEDRLLSFFQVVFYILGGRDLFPAHWYNCGRSLGD